MLRCLSHRRLFLLLCLVTAGLCVCVPCAYAGSAPAILRTDAFIATPYDANTAIVFFNSNALVPAGLGAPAGKLPEWVAVMTGWSAHLRLENSDGEMRWRHYWPGGEAYAPKLGGQYVLALGENNLARGMLSSLGYLTLCGDTWLVGLVTVEEADRGNYAEWNHPVGIVVYPEPEGGLPVLKPIPDRDEFSPRHLRDTLGEKVLGSDRIFSTFPLDALPMLEQGDEDAGNQWIVLTQQQNANSVIYSLKRVTPGALVPAGVYFEDGCKPTPAQ
jgi:hypothetical protein